VSVHDGAIAHVLMAPISGDQKHQLRNIKFLTSVLFPCNLRT